MMILRGLTAALLVAACTPAAPSAPPPEVDSVVVLMCNGLPCCNAFAVAAAGSPPVLVTAAHCLKGARPGAQIAYVSRHDWEHTARGVETATVLSTDAMDRATLSLDYALPAFLAGAEDPESPLHAISAFWGWSYTSGYAIGTVYGPYGFNSLTTLDVQPGWSGSPVLDDGGRAVAIVRACEVEPPTPGCLPQTGIIVSIEGMQLRP